MDRAPATLSAAFPRAQPRPLDGETELAVAEAVAAGRSRPARVTAVIAAMYVRLEQQTVDRDVARHVSSAGREWLLQRAALRFYGANDWYEAICSDCGARFDLRLSIADIPCVAPGDGFPTVELETSLGQRAFEVPNGAHEEAFAARQDTDPRRAFAALCGLSAQAECDALQFSERDLARIDAALEAASPEVADSVTARCPECGTAEQVRIDPLTFAFPQRDEILQEVHLLASAYRWSEHEILALPLARRRSYADLIRAGHAAFNTARRR